MTKEYLENNKKKINDYKKVLNFKEKDINVFKKIIQQFKKLFEELKREKNKAIKCEKLSRERTKQIKNEKVLELNEKEKKIKIKEKLIRNLRGKYMEKILQVEELIKKQTISNTELNIYRKFIQNEEKNFGFTSRKYNNPYSKKNKLKKSLQFYNNIFTLDSMNLNKGELILSSLMSKSASLLGWVLFNDKRSKRLNLPNVSLEGRGNLRILLGKDTKKKSPNDLYWLEDLFSEADFGFIHLMDPNGIIQSSIRISEEIKKN